MKVDAYVQAEGGDSDCELMCHSDSGDTPMAPPAESAEKSQQLEQMLGSSSGGASGLLR